MKNIGFGSYRITEHNPEHINALKQAIIEGVDLIDTSTNYMNGESERAIAIALHELPSETTKNVKIVSKFGYIQGSLLEEIKNDIKNNSLKYKNIVKFAEHVYHCIDGEFMSDQLTQSLSRLNQNSIDCYLVHNPEYFIFDAMNNNISREDALDTFYQRLHDSFIALEKEVKKGRIKSYGVSSNSFSKAENDLEFLPYEDLITIARSAAQSAKNSEHHFSTIELPINILEREGLKAAAWAKKNGIRVLANRPLNAELDSEMFRLAEYSEPAEYFHALNAISDFCEEIGMKKVNNLILQLDEKRHKYAWLGEYENFLYTQIIPHIQKELISYGENDRVEIATQINKFLDYYSQMVAYELGEATKKVLTQTSLFQNCKKSLQVCALTYLLEEENIDYILVGMRKVAYTNEVSQINL